MLQPLASDETGRLTDKTAQAWQLTAAVPWCDKLPSSLSLPNGMPYRMWCAFCECHVQHWASSAAAAAL